jgi:hypothetical protein
MLDEAVDVYEDIDNPKTIKEKTKPLLNYFFTLSPGTFSQVCFIWIILPILFILLCITAVIVKSFFILPIPNGANVPGSIFSEARAFAHLKNLTVDFGL